MGGGGGGGGGSPGDVGREGYGRREKRGWEAEFPRRPGLGIN